MKTNDTIYYTPNQIASFFSISRDTLLFYDRIGLFTPAKRKSNGYRCYSSDQLNELDTILTLKDLGVPLAAIKEAVGDIDTTSFLSILENKENFIKEKIDEWKSLLNIVGTIRSSIEEASAAEKEKLYTKKHGDIPIIAIPIKNTEGSLTDDDEWQMAYSRLMAEADCKAIMNIGSIVRLEEARKYLGGIYRELYATYAKPSGNAIPGGRYAYMFFQGSLDNLGSFYRKFFSALDATGLVPEGDIYEELTISTTVAKDEKEHVTKLMVRVS